MDISKVFTDVIHLEMGLKNIYEEIAREKEKDNLEIAKTIEILARESEAHAKKLEIRYEIIVNKTEPIDEGVAGILSLMSESIAKVKEKTLPVDILQEGINIESYMEQFYSRLAKNYEVEEEISDIIEESQKNYPPLSQLFSEIAADERKHQKMLQVLLDRIVDEDLKTAEED